MHHKKQSIKSISQQLFFCLGGMKADKLTSNDRRYAFQCGQVRCALHYGCKWTPVTTLQGLFNQQVDAGYYLVGVKTKYESTKM